MRIAEIELFVAFTTKLTDLIKVATKNVTLVRTCKYNDYNFHTCFIFVKIVCIKLGKNFQNVKLEINVEYFLLEF